jgi:RecA-family ATPase
MNKTVEQISAELISKDRAKRAANHQDVRALSNGTYRDQAEPDTIKPRTRARIASSIKAEKVEWLWRRRIPRSAITILEGEEGIGKGTLLCALAAAVTRGIGLADMDLQKSATVLWFSGEDSASIVLVPRLTDAGADLDHVVIDDEAFALDARGIAQIKAECQKHKPAVIIIDPVFAYTSGNNNEGHNSRSVTTALKNIAAEFKCAIILVRHIGKSKGLGDPRAAGLGSIEWRAAARSVLLAGADPENSSKRALCHIKHNLSEAADPIGYEIRTDETAMSGARFYWGGQTDLTAERILANLKPESEEDSEQKIDAVKFLRDLLTAGPVESKDVDKALRAARITDYATRKAKTTLGIEVSKEGFKDSAWYWSLPTEGGDSPSSPTEGGDSLDNHRLRVSDSGKSGYIKELREGGESGINHRLRDDDEATPDQLLEFQRLVNEHVDGQAEESGREKFEI